LHSSRSALITEWSSEWRATIYAESRHRNLLAGEEFYLDPRGRVTSPKLVPQSSASIVPLFSLAGDGKDSRNTSARDASRAGTDTTANFRISGLRPALGCIFPACRPHRLGCRDRSCGNRNPRRRLRPIYRGGQRGLRDFRHALLLFRQQRSYQAQRLDFFFQPRQFHLFLPQNFVDVFHVRTPAVSRWFETFPPNSSRVDCIVKAFGS